MFQIGRMTGNTRRKKVLKYLKNMAWMWLETGESVIIRDKGGIFKRLHQSQARMVE